MARIISNHEEIDATEMTIEELNDHLNVAITFLKSAETEPVKVAQASVQPISKKDQLATFFFRITPTVSMTIDGNHPLVFIIHDLEALGTARTFCYKKPDGRIENWDLYLSTTITQTEFETHFSFVKDECQVVCSKLLAYDLFSSEEFTQFVEHFTENPTDPEELIAFVRVIALNFNNPRVL